MDAEQEDYEGLGQVVEDSVHKLEPTQDTEDVAPSIQQRAGAGIIDGDLNTHLMSLHSAAFKQLPSTDLPLMNTKSKYCLYVEIHHKGKTLYIHKTTAVWLFQEGERVSTDWLF